MKKIFTRYLFMYMLAGLLISVAAIFVFQTATSKANNTRSSEEKLLSVEEKLVSNEEQVQQLTDSLGENNLAKTRAFARILAEDPTVKDSKAKMEQLCDELMVNELHVIDENGIITNSTVDDYIGFDMAGGEQSAEFLEIISDPSLEIVQKPQKNSTEGTVIQYIGVARQDAKGCVQAGVRPEALENLLKGTATDVVLADFDFGATGYIFAVDKESGEILAHRNAALVGTQAVEAGFPKNLGEGAGSAAIDGTKGYYVAKEYGGMIIGTMMPEEEYYEDRISQTAVVSVCMLIIFILLLFMINHLVERKIVRGIHSISNDLLKIAEGNFDVEVREKSNPEFKLLSQNINLMAANIRQNMDENEQLMEQQQEDMQRNLRLIEQIKGVCTNLDSVSRETLENSQNIHSGTEEQEGVVGELKMIMDELAGKLKNSASVSEDISGVTIEAVNEMLSTKEKMELLKESMEEISTTSKEIGQIIEEIDSIAEQTNMLSLNASIEAARAGDAGRGFAVVANQVGELAARSAEAAKETNALISNSIHAVEKGKEITDITVDHFTNVVKTIESANQGVNEITGMVNENVKVVSEAVNGLNRITEVVEQNVEISRLSERTAENMAKEAENLSMMVD